MTNSVDSNKNVDVESVENKTGVHILNFSELEPHSKTTGGNGTSIPKRINPIHAVKTKLQVNVGTLELSVGELLNAKEHQVFALNNRISDPVELLLEGQVVARGQLVAVDGYFAVKLTELPVSLKA